MEAMEIDGRPLLLKRSGKGASGCEQFEFCVFKERPLFDDGEDRTPSRLSASGEMQFVSQDALPLSWDKRFAISRFISFIMGWSWMTEKHVHDTSLGTKSPVTIKFAVDGRFWCLDPNTNLEIGRPPEEWMKA